MADLGVTGPSTAAPPHRVDGRAEFLRHRRRDVHATSPGSPFAYVSRRLGELVADLMRAAAPGPGALVVDYGCADAPYRELLPTGVEYAGADLAGNEAADLVLLPDGSLPLADGSARVVLSTQVLEHVADPSAYLAECARVLEPGGSLVLTTHGIMYLHRDPEDYWRWTCDGLTRIVTAAGFVVEEQRGLLGLVPAALQLLQDGSLARVPASLRKPYVAAFQRLIELSDRRSTEQSRRENGLVLAVRARRPS